MPFRVEISDNSPVREYFSGSAQNCDASTQPARSGQETMEERENSSTKHYVVETRCGAKAAIETRDSLRRFEGESVVYCGKIGGDPAAEILRALRAIEAEKVVSGFRVAIKINLGGGINDVPSSYTDPLILKATIDAVRAIGGEPFVCEANMRTLEINKKMLIRRGIYPVLAAKDVDFVNLSEVKTIDFYPLGWRNPVKIPEILLGDEVRIMSLPAVKNHWECGVTLSQKNMYGALSERRKSIFHRGSSIDETVAAAARALPPDIALLSHRCACKGIGPHLCVPIRFDYVIASLNSVAADMVCCSFLGVDWRHVKHLLINGAARVSIKMAEGSEDMDEESKKRASSFAMNPSMVRLIRLLLYPQYFVPHAWQYRFLKRGEPLLTLINKIFFEPFGDADRRGNKPAF